ncbi:hypothetical protein FBEOM_4308 [Fusarium beomiforme]|uniref:Reticulocyte-binding protein 2 n=1 Tax=Fusarium beomiforme TaxID=44412 RepID=A0A9P5AN31_9HYPO|nr:hypothetical protein FBEOM_4308 [Fusarium beomiforme]
MESRPEYSAPGASYWGSYVPPPSLQQPNAPPQSSADDEEKIRLKAEIQAYKAFDDKMKAAEERKKREDEIRKETEIAFRAKMEEIKKAQEESRVEIERVRKEAEAAAWDKAETVRREKEAAKIHQEHQAKIMESEIRLKIEIERKAEEAEKRAREKLERDMELRLHAKMMGKVDDFMEVAKQRFLTFDMLNSQQSVVMGMENQGQADYTKPANRRMEQQELSPSQHTSSTIYSSNRVVSETPYSSPPPQREYPSSIADETCGSRPPSVPDAPNQFFYGDDLRSCGSSAYYDYHPNLHPYTAPSSNGRARYQSYGYESWQSPRQEQSRSQIPIHPDLVQQIAYAVTEVLRAQTLDAMMADRGMRDRPTGHRSPSMSQTPLDPREYVFPSDRAAAIENERQRRADQSHQKYLARQLWPSEQMSYRHAQTFDRPPPSPSIIPRTRRSSVKGIGYDGHGSESDSSLASAYETPPETHRVSMFPNAVRPLDATLAMAPMPQSEIGDTTRRTDNAIGNDGSRTYVNSSMGASVRDTKLEDKLSAAMAHMNLQQSPSGNSLAEESKYHHTERGDVSQYLVDDFQNTEN